MSDEEKPVHKEMLKNAINAINQTQETIPAKNQNKTRNVILKNEQYL